MTPAIYWFEVALREQGGQIGESGSSLELLVELV
jgi:hypothetical protein